ncbi:MAG: LamG domain-containing protein [Armatimonadota bacterium]|jgi:hypothetical protein
MSRKLYVVPLAALLIALLAGTVCQAPAGVALARGEGAVDLDADPHLVGWWKLDEQSGTTAADSSKHGRDGALDEGVSFDANSAPGRMGRALKLDGKSGILRIPEYKGVSGTHPRTVAAWIKTTNSRGQILSWGERDFGKMWTFGFIRGRVGVTPKGGYLYVSAEIHDDTWHHVAAVVEEADRPNLHDHVKLYLDGTPAEIHRIGLLDLWPVDTGSDQDVEIGPGFNGLVDDVRIYDRALSEDDVGALFRSAR